MMDVNAYINSGIIEDYCLGMLNAEQMNEVERMSSLYSEVEEAIEANRTALENYIQSIAITPSEKTKAKALAIFENLAKEKKNEREITPIINKYSNHENWLRIVKPDLPPTLEEEKFHKVIREDENVFQLLLWAKTDYPYEDHDNVHEIIYVLEGECQCCVGDDVYPLGPGDMLEIPLYVQHNLEVTNGPVIAVVQRLKVAV
jgi:mannose-6-phosphate isomerase-like protein (cupin superfamily)